MAAALAILTRRDAFLLVRRRNPPDQDLWGYPGGKIEHGETIMQAAIRELQEETGFIAAPKRLLAPLELFRHGAAGEVLAHFILLPVLCDWVSGSGQAASDAAEIAWFTPERMAQQASLLSHHVLDLALHAVAAG